LVVPVPSVPSDAAPAPRFRTIQVRPKDLGILLWQVAGDVPPSNEKGRAKEERISNQSRGSDTLAKVLYPTLFFLVMLLWVYVPA
jgi:hypothetical protein